MSPFSLAIPVRNGAQSRLLGSKPMKRWLLGLGGKGKALLILAERAHAAEK
jgi:hypothetical protein